jgi:hypothetical protein
MAGCGAQEAETFFRNFQIAGTAFRRFVILTVWIVHIVLRARRPQFIPKPVRILKLGKLSRQAEPSKPSTPINYGQSLMRATLFYAYFPGELSDPTGTIPNGRFQKQ